MADELAYKILDADNHFNEPLSLYEQYIDPDKKDLAITVRKDDNGKDVHLYAGEPSKFTVQGFVDGITEKQAESWGPSRRRTPPRRPTSCRASC